MAEERYCLYKLTCMITGYASFEPIRVVGTF